MKKITLIFLIGAISLLGLTPVWAQRTYNTLTEYEKLTGKRIEAFNDAPMLKVKVAAGELPVVEERLPEEPLVVEPLEKIGRYGGILRAAAGGPQWGGVDAHWPRDQGLFSLEPDLKTITPNITKGWDLSKDYKTLTIYLRKGMKWSDGVPFTADDFLFWYEDIILNDELTPVKPKDWSPGGELVKVKKVNDYELRFEFAIPYPPIVIKLSYWWGKGLPFTCKHYLEQYHIKYNPEANEIAKREGFDSWWKCFQSHNDYSEKQYDTNLPTVFAWKLKKVIATGDKYFERNPYYWKIDTAGNQLPYIDSTHRMLVENTQVYNLKAIAGEFDNVGFYLALENYPLYKEGEEKGGYHVMLWNCPSGAEPVYVFHQCHEDPVLRKIFRDIRFRQAMSLAINRDEINNLLYYGKGTPRQAVPDSSCSFYEDWWGKYYAEYDPTTANKLLDEMGLKWDKNHEYRLRPDGKTLAITLEFCESEIPLGEVDEQVARYWEKVGVKVAVKELARTLLVTRGNAGKLDVGNFSYARVTEPCLYDNPFYILYSTWVGNNEWYNWYITDGKAGEEPPAEVKEEFKLIDQWQQVAPGTEEYMKLAKEIFSMRIKNLVAIGTIGATLKPVIIKNNLRNTPKEGAFTGDFHFWQPYMGDQWFFEE